ncbi:hypothetical protein DERF_006228 [Dermatophagoides farinae]|uniref:Uncharacterized protein n=1 Tax=Dermatophagoides farinae TaxID=6954 RepID=A0A922I727_DERFA|nr:hypothetical protein DERF_006228 [Dermatophagoides farinae]
MKFYPQRLFDVQTRRNQLQLIRKCCHFTICHSCWCSFIIGIILLIIGIILICNIIRTSHYNLIMGTGSVPIYPIRLNHDDNNNNQPPPTYNEIISRQQQQQLQNNNNNEIVVEVATIEPSQIINMAII